MLVRSHSGRLPVPGIVIIPARNEAATVREVVCGVRAHVGADVVVVDDASTDATAAEAAAAGAQVLRMPFRAGAWGATQAGMRYALARGYRLCMTLDADGQHSPAAMPRVAAPVIQNVSDLSIGICPERVSRTRHAAWKLFRYLTGLRVQDVTSGMRVYNAAAMRVLTERKAALLDYQDIGVLLMLREAGLRAAEVRVRMSARQSGRSRVYDSWWAVGHYLLATLLLSTGKWRPSWYMGDMFVTASPRSGGR